MRKYLYWLFPITWIGIIYLFSSQPYERQNIQPFLGDKMDLAFIEPYVDWVQFTYNQSIISVESLGLEGFIEFIIRKGAHVFVFFILCVLFYIAFKKTVNLTSFAILSFSFLLTCMYAGFDEFHQSFTPNRTAYIGDVFLDSFGGLLAVIVLFIIQKMKSDPYKKRWRL